MMEKAIGVRKAKAATIAKAIGVTLVKAVTIAKAIGGMAVGQITAPALVVAGQNKKELRVFTSEGLKVILRHDDIQALSQFRATE